MTTTVDRVDVRELSSASVGRKILIRRNGIPEARTITQAAVRANAFIFTLDDGRTHTRLWGDTLNLIPDTRMSAGELAAQAIGSEVEFRAGDVIVFGQLSAVTHFAGMVSMTVDGQQFMLPEDKPVTVTALPADVQPAPATAPIGAPNLVEANA